jgi:hypothetical protein
MKELIAFAIVALLTLGVGASIFSANAATAATYEMGNS